MKVNKIFSISLLLGLYFNPICSQNFDNLHSQLDVLLTNWHDAAAKVNFEDYFDDLLPSSIYIGTDPTELWSKEEFMAYAKPHFKKGKAWSFKKVERNIYYTSQRDSIAWFDELLQTQMGLCRGSGVLIKKDASWYIQHYVLSIAIPNEHVSLITKTKKKFDSLYISNKK